MRRATGPSGRAYTSIPAARASSSATIGLFSAGRGAIAVGQLILNDYEGIMGYEEIRGDLSLMYFVDVDPASANLRTFDMAPLQIRKCQLARPSREDVKWLQRTLDQEGAPVGTRVAITPNGQLSASWLDAKVL